MKIDIVEECPTCNGTGLYVGLCERDGAAVVCSKCGGSGKYRFQHEYQEFTGKKLRDGVKRVFECSTGIVIGERKGLSLSDFGGIDYTRWFNGEPFPAKSEDRQHTCPEWWYQIKDYNLKPNWDCCTYGLFSSCPYFCAKDGCWIRWDTEHEKND